MPTIFIALQCCQCSTMQVKQKKNSSNKWSCVVCNQKQSVRKVYAQGFMAKDVRKFVQSFNMSRQLAEQNVHTDVDEQKKTLEIEEPIPNNRKQKRTDWSEYIGPEEEEESKSCGIFDEHPDDEFEQKIVTEMPKALFKKPKMKNYRDTSNGDGEKPYMPVFGKKNPKTKSAQQASDSSRYSTAEFGGTSDWKDYAAESKDMFSDKQEAGRELQPTSGIFKWKGSFIQKDDDKFVNGVPWRSQSATDMRSSKWSSYITEDDDDLLLGCKIDSTTHASHCNDNTFEAESHDQRVEEYIHPDFL